MNFIWSLLAVSDWYKIKSRGLRTYFSTFLVLKVMCGSLPVISTSSDTSRSLPFESVLCMQRERETAFAELSRTCSTVLLWGQEWRFSAWAAASLHKGGVGDYLRKYFSAFSCHRRGQPFQQSWTTAANSGFFQLLGTKFLSRKAPEQLHHFLLFTLSSGLSLLKRQQLFPGGSPRSRVCDLVFFCRVVPRRQWAPTRFGVKLCLQPLFPVSQFSHVKTALTHTYTLTGCLSFYCTE